MENKKSNIEEFRQTGLLLFVNQFLHIWGWAIAVEVDEHGECTKMYPIKTSFKGFSERDTSHAYLKLEEYMKKITKDKS